MFSSNATTFSLLMLNNTAVLCLFASIGHPRCLFFLRPPITLQHEVSQPADWMVLFVPVINLVNRTVDGAVIRGAVVTDPVNKISLTHISPHPRRQTNLQYSKATSFTSVTATFRNTSSASSTIQQHCHPRTCIKTKTYTTTSTTFGVFKTPFSCSNKTTGLFLIC